MATILGTGEHRYEVVEDWAKLPEGWEFKDVAAVASFADAVVVGTAIMRLVESGGADTSLVQRIGAFIGELKGATRRQ